MFLCGAGTAEKTLPSVVLALSGYVAALGLSTRSSPDLSVPPALAPMLPCATTVHWFPNDRRS